MYRDDVAALAARHAALETEVAHKRRELDATAQLLDEARGARRLPVLANIAVATPCKASWADMAGDQRVRHCGDCKKNVYNLSEMTRDEAEALIFAHEGRLCVRYFKRADGTILFGDCWVGAQKRRKVKVAALATAAAIAGSALATQIGYEVVRAQEPPVDEYQATMGEYVTGGLRVDDDGKPPDGPEGMLGEVSPELAREAAVQEAMVVLRGYSPPQTMWSGRGVPPPQPDLTGFSVPGSPIRTRAR